MSKGGSKEAKPDEMYERAAATLPTMVALNSEIDWMTDRTDMDEICRKFYTDLFESYFDVPVP